MLGVVTTGNGPNVVQLVSVKSPVFDETLRQLFVVRLHLGNSRAQRCKVACHPRRLSAFVQDQPVRMLLHNIGYGTLSSSVSVLSIFYSQLPPSQLLLGTLI